MEYLKGGTQKRHYTEDEVVYRPCPLCGALDCTGIAKERGAIGVVRCNACGMIYVNPRIKEPEKVYWGDASRYYEEARLIFEGKAAHHRDINYVRDLDVIESIKPTGKLLDIGANMGFFLRHAAKRRWEVTGIEPSPSLSEMARRYFGLDVRTAFLHDAGFGAETFDIVTLSDVFEHVEDPRGMLAAVRRVLKPDGILFIKVPNGKYNLLKHRIVRMFKNRESLNDIFDAYEHLSHFTHDTLQRALTESDFHIVREFVDIPINLPVWHEYVGQYYLYPSPWTLDVKRRAARFLFYWISKAEYWLNFKRAGYFAPNIVVIARKSADA
jgi:2-polyprenyl-3-methyl-5-hydroxy-6-metoxy-1,4-benzoquinol methylase